jgi:hypothetical protein
VVLGPRVRLHERRVHGVPERADAVVEDVPHRGVVQRDVGRVQCVEEAELGP